jgi:hypothetical protein
MKAAVHPDGDIFPTVYEMMTKPIALWRYENTINIL